MSEVEILTPSSNLCKWENHHLLNQYFKSQQAKTRIKKAWKRNQPSIWKRFTNWIKKLFKKNKMEEKQNSLDPETYNFLKQEYINDLREAVEDERNKILKQFGNHQPAMLAEILLRMENLEAMVKSLRVIPYAQLESEAAVLNKIKQYAKV